MTRLADLGTRHPIVVLVVAIIITAAAAPGIGRLTLRTDGHALVPDTAPEVVADRAVRRAFDVDDLVVVLIRSEADAGIYDTDALRLVVLLTREIGALREVGHARVSSIATEKGDRHAKGTLDYRTLLDPLPETADEMDRLREEIRALDIHVGTLVSEDGRGAAIHVGVADGVDRASLVSVIARLVRGHATEVIRIDVIGAPVAEALLGSHLLQDLGVPDALLPVTPGGDRETGLRRIGRAVGLVPLAVVIMAIALFVAFRRVAAVPIPLLEVGACLVTVFGLMGWMGVPVYLTTAVLPVILTSIGVADEVHVLSRYQQHLRAGASVHPAAVVATMRDLVPPIVQTSLTTAVAFGAFALSPIGPVRAFGIFAAIGIVFCMTWSIFVTPALLTLMDPRRLRHPRRGAGSDWIAGIAIGAARRRGAVAVAVAAVLVVAAGGIRQITVQDSWIGGFAEDSAFTRATRWFDEQFFGMHMLMVRVDTGAQMLTGTGPEANVDHHSLRLPGDAVEDPLRLVGARLRVSHPGSDPGDELATRPADMDRRHGGWSAWIESARREGDSIIVETDRRQGSLRVGVRALDGAPLSYEIAVRPLHTPAGMARIAELEAYLASRRDLGVGGVLGPARYLTTTSFIVSRRDPAARAIPDEADRVQWLWQQFARVRGERRARQVIDPDGGTGLVTAFLEDANYRSTQRLIDELRAWEHEHLFPHGMRLTLAGDVAVSQALITAVVRTQVRSLLASLLIIVGLTTIMTGSLRWGLASVIPCATAVLVCFAVMGYGGLPLGVATSMFAGMVLGIGVDYAIHFLQRHRHARCAGLDREASLRDAASTAGRAIVIDALVVGLGFGVLILSQVPANARLGAMAALCIAACLVATLTVLPAIVAGPASRAQKAE